MSGVMSGVGPPFFKNVPFLFFFFLLKPEKECVCLLDISFHILTEKMNAKDLMTETW